MADVKISALPPAPALTSTSIFAVVEAGVTYKADVTQVAAAFPISSALVTGLLSSADWTTFNGKQDALILTTVGSSGAATLIGNTLNIPQYSGGVTTIGVLDSVAKSANGAVISGSNLIMQTAEATFPGLVSTGTQTFAGSKTFSSAPTFTGFTAGSVLFAGTGGLVSQDNSNLFWDNTNKRLGIGTTAPVGKIELSSDSSDSIYYASTFNNVFNVSSSFIIRRARGTAASPSAVQSGDRLGAYAFSGYNGSSYAFSALIIANAAENFGANSGSNFSFENTPIGSNTRRAVATLFASGNLTIQNGGTFTDAGFRLDVNGTERVQGRLTVNQDTTVATQTVAVIQSGTTNASLVLNPNGTGAIIASIPDGGVTGGNARGANAVDLQMIRTAATQVASGVQSVLIGGTKNTSSGTGTVVLGGDNNTASGTWAAGIGGRDNFATGAFGSVTIGGQTNNASGVGAVVIGGFRNTSTTEASVTQGTESRAYLHAQRAHSSGAFSTNVSSGDAQNSTIIFRRIITGQTIQELYLDGASIQAILALPTGATNARMWTVQVQLSAIVATVGAGTVLLNDCFSGTYTCAIKRVGSSAAMIGNVTPQGELSDASMTSSIVTIDADTATYALRIRYTPPSPQAAVDTIIRVVATAYLTEVGR